MSSGDPIVDEQTQRESALNNLLNSLSETGGDMLLAAETAGEGDDPLAETTGEGDDPLIDRENEARARRQKLVDSLTGKGGILLEENAASIDLGSNIVQQTTGTTTVEDALNSLNNSSDLAAQVRGRRILGAEAGPRHQNFEASSPDRIAEAESSAVRWRRTLTASENTQLSSPESTDLAQMFGGAFLLIAAVALFAVVNRRRKYAKKQTEQTTECDYQLYM